MLSPAILAALALAAASGDQTSFPAYRDPGGCRLELVAAEPETSSWQVDGVSPDGRSIAIGWARGETSRGTYLLDLETGQRTDVPEFNNGASFSPDGRTLLHSVYLDSGKTDIVEMDLKTRAVETIAAHPDWDFLPSYSPDGSQILFNSYRTGNSDIYLFDRASRQLRRLTDSDAYEAHARLSPDGGTVAFHRQAGEVDYDLFLLDVVSGEETRLTSSPREESYPSWLPDGRHLVFSSDRDNDPGKPDLFVMDRQGRVVTRLTDHPEKDAYAFASPDGEYVYFNSDREPQGVYRMRLGDDLECETNDPTPAAGPRAQTSSLPTLLEPARGESGDSGAARADRQSYEACGPGHGQAHRRTGARDRLQASDQLLGAGIFDQLGCLLLLPLTALPASSASGSRPWRRTTDRRSGGHRPGARR